MEENYKKIGQLIRYVGKTIHIPLILGADDSKTQYGMWMHSMWCIMI